MVRSRSPFRTLFVMAATGRGTPACRQRPLCAAGAGRLGVCANTCLRHRAHHHRAGTTTIIACMLKLDQGNRVVTMDRAFHDDSASFSFDNCEGPHGRVGSAKPHSVVFPPTTWPCDPLRELRRASITRIL